MQRLNKIPYAQELEGLLDQQLVIGRFRIVRSMIEERVLHKARKLHPRRRSGEGRPSAHY